MPNPKRAPVHERRTSTHASVAVFDQGAVTVQEIALPDRRPAEIDVEITSAAICGSDLHTVLGHRAAPARLALGHEGIGRVSDVSPGAVDMRGTPLRRGDRVVFALFSACGSCDRCAGGLAMKCRSVLKYGHESVDTAPHATGTLATHVRLLPGVPVLRVPDVIDDAHLVSAGCAVATAAAMVAAADPAPPGAQASGTSDVPPRALVFGAGAVGAYCAAMLLTYGCTVWVRDPSAARLEFVESLGARTDDAGGATFPVVLEASGSADAFTAALHAADVGGRVVAAGSVSPGSTSVTFDPAHLVTRRISLIGIHNYTGDEFRAGVDWLLAHGHELGLERLVSPPVALANVDQGIQLMRDGIYPRVVVRPGTSPGASPEANAEAHHDVNGEPT